MKPFQKLTVVILSALLISLLPPARSVLAIPLAAPIETVTNTNDAGPNSLRQAILDVDSGGIIKFSPAISGSTIHLASSIAIAKNLTIDGETHNITISGDSDSNGSGDVTVFIIEEGGAVTLNNLTIVKGKTSFSGGNIFGDGGGVLNLGTLIVTNCTFSENSANLSGGGIGNISGKLVVYNSIFSGNFSEQGGGISTNSFVGSSGTAIINNSIFVANSAAAHGGGIANTNNITMLVSNSLFFGNTAGQVGGGIAGSADLSIYNVTFSGNSAGAGGGGINWLLIDASPPGH